MSHSPKQTAPAPRPRAARRSVATALPLIALLGILGAAGQAEAATVVNTNFAAATSLDASGGRVFWEDGDNILRMGHLEGGALVFDSVVDDDFDVARPGAFAVGGGHIYWQEEGTTQLKRGRIVDGSLEHVEILASDFNVASMAADMGYLYWVDLGTHDLRRGRVKGTGNSLVVETLDIIDTGFDDDYLMAADGGHLYFKAPGAANLYRITPHPDGYVNFTTLATDAQNIDLLAVTGGEMVWREGSNDLYETTMEAQPNWLAYARDALDTLIDKGRDTYGPVHTNMILSTLSLDALAAQTPPYAPEDPPILDNVTRTEGRTIDGRLSPAGSNLWMDMPLIGSMHILTDMLPTSDPGRGKYRDAADDYVRDYLRVATDSKGGIFWGSHTFYDAHKDVRHTMIGMESTLGEKHVGNIDMIAMAGGGSAKIAGPYGGTWVYWLDSNDGLHRGAYEGGRIYLSQYLGQLPGAVQIAADDADDSVERVYVLYGNGVLQRLTLSNSYSTDIQSPGMSFSQLATGVSADALAAAGDSIYYASGGVLRRTDTSFNNPVTLRTGFYPVSMGAARDEGTSEPWLVWRDAEGLWRAKIQTSSLGTPELLDPEDASTLVAVGMGDWSKGGLFTHGASGTWARNLGSSFSSNRFHASDPHSQGMPEDTETSALVFDDASGVDAELLAAAGNALYWREETTPNSTLYRADATTGLNPTVTAVATSSAALIAGDLSSGGQEQLYWVDGGTTTLKRATFDSGTGTFSTPDTLSSSFTATALAVHAGAVYWNDGTDCKRATVSGVQLTGVTTIKSGCTVTQFAAGGDGAGGTSLFYKESGTPNVLRRGHLAFDDTLVQDEVVGHDRPGGAIAANDSQLYTQNRGAGRIAKRKVSRTDLALTETLVTLPRWEHIARIDTQSVLDYAQMSWDLHINDPDKESASNRTCRNNRHNLGEEQSGHAFGISSGNIAATLAYAALHSSGQAAQDRLGQAVCVADWHYHRRAGNTGLPPDDANLVRRGLDGGHTYTSVSGVLSVGLLDAFSSTQESAFFTQAVGYIKGYDTYAYQTGAGAWTYWNMLDTDLSYATPDGQNGSSYGDPIGKTSWSMSNEYLADGFVNIWRDNMYTDEFPLVAAQAALRAYELGGSSDSDLKAIAVRWAEAIERQLPAMPGRRWGPAGQGEAPNDALQEVWGDVFKVGGTYAENYGRAISFFIHLHQATGEDVWLAQARDLGREAILKLWRADAKLFRAHPHKEYYQANGGVGLLIHALLELANAESAQSLSLPMAL